MPHWQACVASELSSFR